MKYSLCIGAYPGRDVIYHLEKIEEHGFYWIGMWVYERYGSSLG